MKIEYQVDFFAEITEKYTYLVYKIFDILLLVYF